MFGNNNFIYSYLGLSFKGLFAQMGEWERKRKNEEAGIVFDAELSCFGVPEKNIPFNYIKLDFTGKHYIAVMGGKITVYDENGSYLFTGTEFKDLCENMYLVRLVDDEMFCLFRGFEKLSEPIFYNRDFYISGFKPNYCSLSFKDTNGEEGECVIDKDGNIILEHIGRWTDKHFSVVHNIAYQDKTIYNLNTGEVICYCEDFYKKIEADGNLIFVELRHPTEYGAKGKGVCKINTMTTEFEIFGTIPYKEEDKYPEKKKQKEEEAKRLAEIEAAKPRVTKQSRNEKCQCGSGKKFKDCCINKVGQILEKGAE